MANTFISVKEIARQTLPRLLENLVFPNLIYKDYSNDYQDGKGATIQVRKPVVLTASEFDAATGTTAQDIKQTSVDVTLDKIATVDAEIGALEHAVSVDNLNAIFIEPAAAALAEKINSDGLGLYADIPNCCGTAGTTPDGLDDFANAAKILNKLKAPTAPRHGVWDPDADAKFKQLPALVNANKSGTTAALRSGAIGDVFGIDNYMAQGIKTHTVGATGTPLVDYSSGYSAGATQIHVDGLTTAFKVGDLFTIANDSTQYVVVTAGALSTADQDIGIYPALAKNTADNAALTVVTTHVANLVFVPQAFAFVCRPLIAPAGAESYTVSYNGISLRVVRDYNMQYKKDMLSMDVLYGYKTMYPELACRVLG